MARTTRSCLFWLALLALALPAAANALELRGEPVQGGLMFGEVQPGSRVTYRQMFAGDASAVSALRRYMSPRLGVSERIRDLSDAGPEIRSALDRAQRFLGLAALTGTLLAAVAMAGSDEDSEYRYCTEDRKSVV